MNRKADRIPFYRMSALRQAVLLTGVFIVILMIAGGFAFGEFERQFNRRVETELATRFSVIRSDIETRGFDENSYPATGIERVLFLPDGQSSRLPLFKRQGFFDWNDDLEDNDHHQRGGPDFHDWRYLSRSIDGGQLVVGTSLGRSYIFLEIIFQTLGFTGFVTITAALIFAAIFGFRNQRRVNAISQTLTRVAEGDLNARIDAKRNRDDLDALSHRINHTTARLDVLLRQTRDFSANIAHDLKTPLARLRIRLENALIAENKHGDSAEDIALSLEQTDKVIAIFDAFLRISKLESGATKTEFAPVDLTEIAQEVAEIYDAVIEDSGRHFETRLNGPVSVHGDRVLLIQMLANMIENALRHTPTGTTLTLITAENSMGLADTGPGIPEAEREKVTQPLYRLEKSRTTEGAGLGLSLVKTIADIHGADLVLTDTPYTDHGLYIRAVFD